MTVSTVLVWAFLVWMPRMTGEWTTVGQFATWQDCEQYRHAFFASYLNENILIQVRPCMQIRVDRQERT